VNGRRSFAACVTAAARATRAFDVVDRLGVRRPRDVGFGSWRRGELTRKRGFARELVEGVGVDVYLVGDTGDEGQGLAVRADDGRAQFEIDGQERQSIPNSFEDDLGGFDLLRRTMSAAIIAFCGRRFLRLCFGRCLRRLFLSWLRKWRGLRSCAGLAGYLG